MTGIVICADDFGMHPEVDRAIVDLARQGRLSATSVLVDGQGLEDRASDLKGLDIDVGLHLNLTEIVGELRTHDVQTQLGRLIAACYSRTVSRSWLQEAIDRQLDRYEAVFGCTPAYVDGHQHVHQLPVVREVLIEALQHRYGSEGAQSRRPWIRSTRAIHGLMKTGARQWFKAQVIEMLGAKAMERLAIQAGLLVNYGFAGVYDFTQPSQSYGTLLQGWLDGCQQGALIMCHPSAQVLDGDPVGQARLHEYHVLSGADMGDWLIQRNLQVMRLNQVFGSRSSLP